MPGLTHKSGKSPEKCSNFAMTCNLLSQYLKNGGSFGDFSLMNEVKGSETTRPPAIAMNLFPDVENCQEMMGKVNGAANSTNPKLLDFLSQFATTGSPTISEETSKADLRSAPVEPETAQMTIFYGGQVIVFDDFPSDKAKETMDLAKQASSQGFNGFVRTFTFGEIDFNNSVDSEPNIVKEQVPLQPQNPISSDLPLARKASLRRFLEKRKDRVAIRGPYQTSKTSDLGPSRFQNSSPWIDLEALPSTRLELRL